MYVPDVKHGVTMLTPRPFQVECVTKLAPQRTRLIGDEMGLGKTVEAILLDKTARDEVRERSSTHYDRLPPTLVVAPLSLLSSWEDHFNDWEPGLKTCVINRKDRTAFERALEQRSYDLYIMHWDAVRLTPTLADRRWLHVIGDEIHRIANRDAQVTLCFKKYLQTIYKTGLSGTPAQTRPQDLWSILNWLKPKEFRSFWRFFNYHVIHKYHTVGQCQVEDCFKQHKHAFREITGIAHEGELQEKIRPFYIRRLKEDVAKDLPPKYYSTITVELDPRQRRAYDKMRDDMLAWVGQHEDEPLVASMAVAKLVRLQQLSAAYAQVSVVMKKIRLSDGTEEMRPRDVVTLTEPSSKLDAVMQIVTDNLDKQFVIFSVSRQVVDLMAARLEKAKITHAIFTGNTPQDERGRLVKEFQAGQRHIFVGTIAAGGIGLTLTAASTIIFVDRDWSPAKNRQAEDRLHRIGQKMPVQVIDVIAANTVDMGKLQHVEQSWSWLKRLLGDKDYEINPQRYKAFEGV